jgi:RimJ/RimL family protein N-acetyltransferase
MSDFPPQPMLQTARLTLRPMSAGDADAVRRLAGDPDVAASALNIPYPFEPEMAEEWIARQAQAYEEAREVTFAIIRRSDEEFVGAIGLDVSREHERAELGYWVGQPFWGRGYATEAAFAVLEFAFKKLLLNRVYANHFADNPASGRVLEKIGMAREGCQRQHVLWWGEYRDLVCYGITRERFTR